MYKLLISTLLFSAEPDQIDPASGDQGSASLSQVKFCSIQDWLEQTEFSDAEKKRTLDAIQVECSAELLNEMMVRLKDLGIFGKKCSYASDVCEFFVALKKIQLEHFHEMMSNLKDLEIFDKCKTISQVTHILEIFGEYPFDRFIRVATWLKDSKALDKCKDLREYTEYQCWFGMRDLIKALKVYPLKNLENTLVWIKTLGGWDKCQSGMQILVLLGTLKDYPPKRFEKVSAWLKKTGVMDKVEDWSELSWWLQKLRNSILIDLDKPVYPADVGNVEIYVELYEMSPNNDRLKAALISVFEQNPSLRHEFLDRNEYRLGLLVPTYPELRLLFQKAERTSL